MCQLHSNLVMRSVGFSLYNLLACGSGVTSCLEQRRLQARSSAVLFRSASHTRFEFILWLQRDGLSTEGQQISFVFGLIVRTVTGRVCVSPPCASACNSCASKACSSITKVLGRFLSSQQLSVIPQPVSTVNHNGQRSWCIVVVFVTWSKLT